MGSLQKWNLLDEEELVNNKPKAFRQFRQKTVDHFFSRIKVKTKREIHDTLVRTKI